MPIAPPISRPRLREMIKYAPPTPTRVFVAIADRQSAVMKVMPLARATTSNVLVRPTWPRTHPKRKYMMTPRMVKMVGVNTPRNMPREVP